MASEHSNTVTINGSMIRGISYINDSLIISSGQPSSPPPIISQSGSKWTITMECGRHKTSEVADAFTKVCGSGAHEYAPSGGGGTPDELNFFYEVIFIIDIDGTNYKVNNVCLAQGSYSSTNNWWIGVTNIVNNVKTSLIVAENGIVVGTISVSGTHDSFDFNLI
jgi:hypothetical protein